MSRLGVVAIACLACSAAPKPVKAVNVSADRASPQVIDLGARSKSVTIDASAPSAGTWWYLVLAPHPADARTSIEFATNGRPKIVTFALRRDDGTSVPAPASSRFASRLVIDETTDAPERYVLEVTTTAATRFKVSADYAWRQDSPPEVFEERPQAVLPKCPDLNRPDFNNIGCCQARCSFGSLGCKSKLTGNKIALGARDEIMVYARGELYVRNQFVSDVWVTNVGETESSIHIVEKTVDPTKLGDNTMVILSPPGACVLRHQSRP